MNKQEFLAKLKTKLSGLPQKDIDERLGFYSEIIDDRMEEGLSEEEAVAGIGDLDDIVSQILSEFPLSKLVKEKVRPKRRLRVWEIMLIILGFPFWFPILIATLSVAFAVYAAVWSAIFALWACDFALLYGSISSIISIIIFLSQGNIWPGVAMFGACLLFAGAAILMFYGCVAATRGIVALTKKCVLGAKYIIIGKESSK